ncbi:putative cytochrome c oxidase subunit IV superfamily [Plasmopara halstedii]
MFYTLSQKLSKGSTMAITIPTIIGMSYATFAFFRYTGPDNGGSVRGTPKTTSAEWQAASIEYGKAQKANPIRHFRD